MADRSLDEPDLQPQLPRGGGGKILLRALLFVALGLAVPILPFLFLGDSFERSLTVWSQQRLTAESVPLSMRFAVVAGVLTADILLPVPSSAVSTYAGGVMGLWPAMLASWFGMTLGACLGFALARLLGQPFAARFAGDDDLQRMRTATERYGPFTLVASRAFPILAEACVLVTGAMHLSWRRFLLPVIASNFIISLTYAACGRYFADRNAFWPAVILSGTIPLLAALAVRRRWRVWFECDRDEPFDS